MKIKFRTVLKSFIWFIPIAAIFFIGCILKSFPAAAEYLHARMVFPVLSSFAAVFVSLFPFSLTETVCVLGIPAGVAAICVAMVKLVRSRRKKKTAGRMFRFCGWFVAAAFSMYMLMHGFNFYRYTVAENLDLDMGAKTPEQLLAVCIDLADRASAEREGLEEDEAGVMRLKEGIEFNLSRAKEYISPVLHSYDIFGINAVRPKGVMLSHYWSYTGITGMYFPFFAEANINIDTVDFSIPYTVCHEIAHTYGFAREDEANFLGYLLSTGSTSAEFRYSGYASAYILCANALYSYDKELWETAYHHVSDGMRRDFAAQNAYWKQFEGEVMDVSSAVNDGFLKAQDQEDGVLSYNRAVALIMAQYEKDGLI